MQQKFNMSPIKYNHEKTTTEQMEGLMGVGTEQKLDKKIVKDNNINYLVINGVDVPTTEFIEKNRGLLPNKLAQKEMYGIIKTIATGHSLGGFINPINLKSSQFMQNVKKSLLSFYGMAIKNCVEKQKNTQSEIQSTTQASFGNISR